MAKTVRNGQRDASLAAMTLPELIQHHVDQGLSIRAIALRGGLSHPTVAKWMRATSTETIEVATIDALARGLGVDRDVVYRAALGIPAPRPFNLPARATRLTDSERRVVLGVVDAILAARADRMREQANETGVGHGPARLSEPRGTLRRVARTEDLETDDPELGG